ncbi:hypothetical protein C8J56DRAFT_893335 [Mycena floridula]|nr:hypothetical protein C8J56DRAFT_893335 [Mycena floridula]
MAQTIGSGLKKYGQMNSDEHIGISDQHNVSAFAEDRPGSIGTEKSLKTQVVQGPHESFKDQIEASTSRIILVLWIEISKELEKNPHSRLKVTVGVQTEVAEVSDLAWKSFREPLESVSKMDVNEAIELGAVDPGDNIGPLAASEPNAVQEMDVQVFEVMDLSQTNTPSNSLFQDAEISVIPLSAELSDEASTTAKEETQLAWTETEEFKILRKSAWRGLLKIAARTS